MPDLSKAAPIIASPAAPRSENLATGAHAFVFLVFVALAISFFASTIQLYLEFRDNDWQTLVFAHSHIFFFFPVFGVLALCAFYIPSVVFTDFYWRSSDAPHALPYGRARFMFGTLIVLAIACWFTWNLSSANLRGVWEISPKAMAEDTTRTVAKCKDEFGAPCIRQTVRSTLLNLRQTAQARPTIMEFARLCRKDLYVETQPAQMANRYCFPAGARMTAEECCKVQADFAEHVGALVTNTNKRSATSFLEQSLTFTKAFFVILLVVISALLVFWQSSIQEVYPGRMQEIERGIIVGAIAMLFWLLMDYGYQQTTDVLFGRQYPGFAPRLSVIVAVWSVLLILYFLNRVDRPMSWGQIITIVASAAAVFQYELVTNASAKLLGIGAPEMNFWFMIALALVGIELVYGWWKLPLPPMRRPAFPQYT